jgi:hypothetical protein
MSQALRLWPVWPTVASAASKSCTGRMSQRGTPSTFSKLQIAVKNLDQTCGFDWSPSPLSPPAAPHGSLGGSNPLGTPLLGRTGHCVCSVPDAERHDSRQSRFPVHGC